MKSIPFSLLLFIAIQISAQPKHDNSWFLSGIYDDDATSPYGITMIDFSQSAPYFKKVLSGMGSDATNTSMSDQNGKLLFYTNGCEIRNREFEIMENGEEINPGENHDDFCNYSYTVHQGAFALPFPERDSVYRLFHLTAKWMRFVGNYPIKVMYSDIDMSANDGIGKVIAANQLILQDTFASGYFTTVKHGNGRDWWIVIPEYYSNNYFIWRFSPEGIVEAKTQKIGRTFDWRDSPGRSIFSPEGSKYARMDPFNKLQIFDFDRCSGVFSNPVSITFEDVEKDSLAGASGIAFSPDSRFLYISSPLLLFQFDMLEDNIASSRETIDTYDGFVDIFPNAFYDMQLAPNGKIYMSSTNGVQYLHVINSPNEKGKSCNFKQHEIQTPTFHGFSMPNFPFYGLYDLQNSICDTLGIDDPVTSSEELLSLGKNIQVYPNPTSDYIKITGLDIFSEVKITIFNSLAIKVFTKDETPTNSKVKIALPDLPKGIYFCTISTRTQTISTKKIIIE